MLRYSVFLSSQGNSDIDQLSKIFTAFGTPKADQWPDMKNLPDYVEYQFVPAPSLRSLFPTVSEDALDLLSKLFTYDPKARISVKQALEHRCLKLTTYIIAKGYLVLFSHLLLSLFLGTLLLHLRLLILPSSRSQFESRKVKPLTVNTRRLK